MKIYTMEPSRTISRAEIPHMGELVEINGNKCGYARCEICGGWFYYKWDGTQQPKNCLDDRIEKREASCNKSLCSDWEEIRHKSLEEKAKFMEERTWQLFSSLQKRGIIK